MEILIVGVLLVALMAYVSTRIKKVAAQAYEREIIETEDFRIVKPEGFLNPVDSEYVFEAYTKEFGEDDAAKFRQSWAVVKVHQDFAGIANEIIENETTEKEVTIQKFRKVLKTDEFYELEVSVLKEFSERYRDRADEMLNSFTLK